MAPSSNRLATLAGIGLTLAAAFGDLFTASAVGVGFLALGPLLAATLGASPRHTGSVAALVIVLVMALGVPDDIFGEAVWFALVAGEAAAGALAIYLARFRTRSEAHRLRAEVQYSVASTLQDAAGLREAAPRLLRVIAEPLACTAGAVWEAGENGSLRCVDTWHSGGPAVQRFAGHTRDLALARGAGYPGQALASGRSVWVEDARGEPDLRRADLAAEAGLRGAVAFPLRTKAGVAGIVEIFSPHTRPPDGAVLDLLNAVGGQIAEFVEATRAAAALRDSEARKRAMLNVALDSVITIDGQGRVLELNPAAIETFGYTEDDAVGREMAELIVPREYRARHRAALERCVETGESSLLGRRVELTAMRRDGTEFPIELTITQTRSSDEPLFTGFVRDITDRRAHEQERERLLELERLARLDADASRSQLAAILGGVADAVTADAPDGTVVFANDRAVRMFGFSSPDEMTAVPLDELTARFHPTDEDGRPVPPSQLPSRVALREGRACEAVVQIEDPDVGVRWSRVKATPVFGPGREVTMAINVIEDVTELKRAEQGQRLLAETGRLLASSLDRDAILSRLAEMVTDLGPAEVCEFELFGSGDESTDMEGVVEPGQIDVALVSDGRSRGRMRLQRRPGHAFGPDDLKLAEELGRRIGGWLQTAQIYAERSYVARTLQQSLLPARLPQIPGVVSAARFRASGQGNEVGGDFYDLFEAGDSSWSAVVGDVCGKGPDAAAVTALARYTLRAAAMTESDPSASLRVLNEAMLRQRSDLRFATVAYASLAPGAGGVRVSVASAGHPLPLVLRADGRVETIGAEGTLAGVVPDPDLPERSGRLTQGDSLVLYTDGVTEARGDGEMLGEGGLQEVLAGCAGMEADAIADAVERSAVDVQHGETRDDIAVVVLQAQATD